MQPSVQPEPTPRVGVIIPTRNRSASLRKALASVLRQTWRDLEVLIVDDASTDDTEAVVRSIGDARVRYLRLDQQRGAGGARNRGIERLQNEWIAFQDSDDTWASDKLEKQMAEADRGDGGVDVVYCRCRRHCDGATYVFPPRHVAVTAGNVFETMLNGNLVSTQTALVRRSCFDRWGLFDESLPPLEDWEFFLRLSRHVAFGFVDEELVEAPYSPDSISRQDDRYVRSFLGIIDRYADDYRTRPRMLARHYGTIADRLCMSGAWREGRRRFGMASRIYPRHAGHWLGWGLSLLPPLYRLIRRIRRG